MFRGVFPGVLGALAGSAVSGWANTVGCVEKIKIAHLSDTHLGYEAYPALSQAGNNQRGEDVVRAFRDACDDIVAWDPPLVIHSGDVVERPKVDIRYMLVAQKYFARLAAVRPDGTRRQVVILAGNHELPRSRKEACWLELLRPIEGVHIVTTQYQQVRFGSDAAPELADVVVHALPHDVLKEVDFETVSPVPGMRNILTAHGVAGGSELFTRALGREYPIDVDCLLRDWEYVALGHWHKQGPVNLGGAGVRHNVWYAGSTENMGFRDLRDNGTARGYLRVALDGNRVEVTPTNVTIRPMFRLPVLDASGLTGERVVEALIARIKAAEIEGAVVAQVVENVTRDLWSLIDTRPARDAAKGAVHYEIVARYKDAGAGAQRLSDAGLGDMSAKLEELVTGLVPEHLRVEVKQLAVKLVGSEVREGPKAPGEGGPPPAADPSGPEPGGSEDTPDAVRTGGRV